MLKSNSFKVFEAVVAYWQVHKKAALPRHITFITGIAGNRLAPYRRELVAEGYVDVNFVHNRNGGCPISSFRPVKPLRVSAEALEKARTCPEVTWEEINERKMKAAMGHRKRFDLDAAVERVVAKAMARGGTMGPSVDPLHDYRRPLAKGSIHIRCKF